MSSAFSGAATGKKRVPTSSTCFNFREQDCGCNLGKVFRVTGGREPTGTEIAAPGLSS
jgi:hypothetical protein